MATKTFSGWECKTEEPVGEFVMRLTTRKTSSGLTSRASCHKLEGNFEVHRIFHDFSKVVLGSKTRVTEKAVDLQHAQAVLQLPTLRTAVEEHYRKLGEM